ncbi:MAG: Flp pilus assembly complex ATPase component TadA [Candidatus Omnitrophica bacterium]|nr:Flp pilus assembly complex ATPase component TadA [Candidatus Omnitrophota bacterium]
MPGSILSFSKSNSAIIFDIPYVKIKELAISPEVLLKIPARIACHYKIFPVKLKENSLTVALAPPMDPGVLDDIKLLVGLDVEGVLADERDIADAIKEYYGIGAETIEGILGQNDSPNSILPLPETEDIDIEGLSGDASIIRFVNQVLVQAVKNRATDIHIEPYEDELRIRNRIDGILYDMPVPQNARRFHAAIISRIKIMARLDIAERRKPQDGRMKVKAGDEDLDLRVSMLPTQFGESADLRILSGSMLYSLSGLGLSGSDMDILLDLIKKPHGIIFVTGPTGSGKTTTLYASLSRVNSADKKIITIEDPIEYQLKGITQVQVNPFIGLGFATGLRFMLRHDPDIMMVGEVRDIETSEITIRAALTGHLVLSTLHTNDAAGGVARLLDMGAEPYLLASSVECFIAQRLIRLICPECKLEKKPDSETIKEFGAKDDMNKVVFYEGVGCESCRFTGFKGRTGIYEFLPVTGDIRELILSRAPSGRIRKKALALGMRTLRMDGWEKIKKGLTTISEVMRVTEKDS